MGKIVWKASNTDTNYSLYRSIRVVVSAWKRTVEKLQEQIYVLRATCSVK